MYEAAVVRCVVGVTDGFKLGVASALFTVSPFLIVIVMFMQESLWTMMFADDVMICSESRWNRVWTGGGKRGRD